MLGSAISRRWVVSLALVGLVSLFMATFSANWANPASATTYSDDQTLAAVLTLDVEGGRTGGPASDVVMVPGAKAHWDWAPKSAAGTTEFQMPGIVFNLTNSNSGCLTVEVSNAAGLLGMGYTYFERDITASSTGGCSSTITVTMTQNGTNSHSDSFVVTVNPLPATAVPTVVPSEFTGTVTPPAGVDADTVKSISPVNGGTLSVNTPSGKKVDLEVPGGAVGSGEGAQVSIKEVSNTGELPPPPPKATQGSSSGTFKFGSSVVQITWYDDKGSAADKKTLNRSAKVCMTATQADVDNAHGGVSGLGIWRHNGTEWVKLNSSVVNNGDGTWKVCANSSQFSPFALGLEVEPPSEEGADAGTGLPATGDYSPNGLILLLAAFAGVAMFGAGAVAARRVRRSES